MFFLVLDLGLENSCDEEIENDDDGGDDDDDDAGDAGDGDSINDDKHPTGSDWGKYPQTQQENNALSCKNRPKNTQFFVVMLLLKAAAFQLRHFVLVTICVSSCHILSQVVCTSCVERKTPSKSCWRYCMTHQAMGDRGKSVYYGFTMILLWFYYDFTMVLLWFDYDFTMVLLWFHYGFTMVLLWVYYGFTMVLLWFYYGFTMCDYGFTTFYFVLLW